MRNATYFARECSTCGRTLNVRVEYLGKRVACPHCRAIEVALDPQLTPQANQKNAAVMERIDQLLALNPPISSLTSRSQEVA